MLASLAAILTIASGCARQTYSGNLKPTSFKARHSDLDGDERERWKQSLFITPLEVVQKCGPPIEESETQSTLADSQYAIIQRHLVYENGRVEVLISQYPNARRPSDRYWFFSGIFPLRNIHGYPKDQALKLMPCLADKIGAWSEPPSSITQVK